MENLEKESESKQIAGDALQTSNRIESEAHTLIAETKPSTTRLTKTDSERVLEDSEFRSTEKPVAAEQAVLSTGTSERLTPSSTMGSILTKNYKATSTGSESVENTDASSIDKAGNDSENKEEHICSINELDASAIKKPEETSDHTPKSLIELSEKATSSTVSEEGSSVAAESEILPIAITADLDISSKGDGEQDIAVDESTISLHMNDNSSILGQTVETKSSDKPLEIKDDNVAEQSDMQPVMAITSSDKDVMAIDTDGDCDLIGSESVSQNPVEAPISKDSDNEANALLESGVNLNLNNSDVAMQETELDGKDKPGVVASGSSVKEDDVVDDGKINEMECTEVEGNKPKDKEDETSDVNMQDLEEHCAHIEEMEAAQIGEIKKQNELESKASEDDNVSEILDDANESVESSNLIIDEKSSENEGASDEFENEFASLEKDMISINSAKDDEKKSCEDTSEMSAATQLDAGEMASPSKKPRMESLNQEAVNESKVVVVDSGVIEIDDEDEENITDTTKMKRLENEITIIEIDDDDEDANPSIKGSIPEDSTKGSGISEEKSVSASADATIADAASTKSSSDENTVQSHEESDASADVQHKNAGMSLLEKALSQPASPSLPKTEAMEEHSEEIFYNKECINHECPGTHKQYLQVPQFALSFYKIPKKKFKVQYVCADCYDLALDKYEELCGVLQAKQPLFINDNLGGRSEIVEILDSSDEEDGDDKIAKDKENNLVCKSDRELLESELENCIRDVITRVDIQSQMTWSKTVLSTRLQKLEDEVQSNDIKLRALQGKADIMHKTLYKYPKITEHRLQPLNIMSNRLNEFLSEQELPPVGEIQRPPIQMNEIYYAVKNKAIASWVPCKIIEQVEGSLGIQKYLKHYKIRFLKSQYQMLKTVSVKHLAYYEPPQVRLPIGTRVIAYFDASSLSRGREKMTVQSAFYPGIIAEPLKPNNKYRYLIFYDDGYTQYVYHKDVRLVCHVSENVWEDVHAGSREFIQKYLLQYSINRPMVQAQRGQSMNTEWNGKWIYARVVDIDCSLIQMQFEGPKSHTEWIYRGSMRLGPVFKEQNKSIQKEPAPVSRMPRRTEPFIRYTEDEERTTSQQRERNLESRAVAKKSTSMNRPDSTAAAFQASGRPSAPTVRHLNNSTIYVDDENRPKGKVVFYTAKRNLPPLKYQPHECSPTCLFKVTHNLSAYSPLSKPLLSGWERQISRQKIKKVVTYRAPCGKIMRNMKELHHYLRSTENVLDVDNFDFSVDINCLAEYVIENTIVQKRDISNGQEKMPIPLVNYYDDTMPPECIYSAKVIPTEGVHINTDPEFLIGCDCEDDCLDKSKCSCWQLTYEGAKYANPKLPIEDVGYNYKRLNAHIMAGIYECNSRCKCTSNCLNRVVQHPMQMKLQVFKTSNRGWGLRCINDVPKGSFICIYAGHLLTETKANERGGLDDGDEYFAELDYIEVAEQSKEGYESEAEQTADDEDEEEDIYAPENDDDDEFTPGKSYVPRSKAKSLRSSRGNQSQNSEEDSQERQVINFDPNAEMNENTVRETSARKLFGKEEAMFVMDAKISGNLGRYFNHSCAPNLIVQNVLVDTHDLRFPWVAFFASNNIRAGTELTWNYNYEVGGVPNKVLYCQCGAPNCRIRLL